VASRLKHLLNDPATDFIVVLSDDGNSIGYAQVRYRFSLWVVGSEAQIDDLFVVQGARERGLGSGLLEAAVAQAQKRGCHLIGLNTNERNADALRLYTRAGFSAVRERWNGGRQLWLERAITGAA
jgi:ribosomal protein S18 acetylase RimI-like enzyme